MLDTVVDDDVIAPEAHRTSVLVDFSSPPASCISPTLTNPPAPASHPFTGELKSHSSSISSLLPFHPSRTLFRLSPFQSSNQISIYFGPVLVPPSLSHHPGTPFCLSSATMTDTISDDVHRRSSPLPPAPMDDYAFPELRLKRTMDDPEKTPLLLVACGSFSPITYLHLRMFEMAADYVKFSTDFELVGGYLSPVSDAYRKAGLASAEHR